MRSFHSSSLLLALETSCDETSAAVLQGSMLLSNVISSQTVHQRYGGVIPELASRAHLESIVPIATEALRQAQCKITDVDGLAVTAYPGLAGALVVGSNVAKGIALRYGLPLVAVNHIEGHIFSACVEHGELPFPFLALVVSGGHTSLFAVRSFESYEVIGSTRDDAAGEAFDKIAKLIGLGYPGGAKIDALARRGNPHAIAFPRAMMHVREDRRDYYDWSFSGLKTAVRNYVYAQYPKDRFPAGIPEEHLPDVAASAQEAIADVLVAKTMRAVDAFGIQTLVVAGGVAANSRLRALLREQALKRGLTVILPSMQLCTDNAAMIGYVGRMKLLAGVNHGVHFAVSSAALRAALRPKQA
jgi:N6-L-threonylcarbamoyladenine synthase